MSRGQSWPRNTWGAVPRRRERAGQLLLALLLTLPTAAQAKRVAVAGFEGPHAAAAEKAVVEVLTKDGHEIVGAAEWKAVLAEIGTKATREETFAAAARKVKVSAIVVGVIKPGPKRAKHATLEITVFDGKTGARLEGFEVPLKRGRIEAAAVTQLTLSLPPIIPLGQDPVGEAAPPAPTPDTESPEALAARRAARAAASQPKVAPVVRQRTIAVGGLGLSLWGRKLKPSPGGTADAYSGGPMPPGLHLEVELWPGAMFTQGILGDLGLGAYFDQTWMSSKYPTASGDVNVASTQTRGGLDVRFRYRLGTGPFSPTLRGAIAFSYTGFKLSAGDRAKVGTLNLADASLYGIGPVVAAVVPLGRPWLRAGASFGAGFVAGPSSNAPSGGTFGNGWDIDFALHVDYLPLKWLQVRAQFGVTYYGESIKSATTTGLADTYLTGLVTASYVY